MQKVMREFITKLQIDLHRELREVGYKVQFWRPYSGAKIDALIEFRAGNSDAWFARANGTDPWRAFGKGMGSLQQIITEMELREVGKNAKQTDSAT
ncbi:MAG: hypothetical protein ACXVBL_07195 [Bdellovibrionota bacterium]